ncbi:hypothetical protein ACQEVM_37465 [Streptomyces sp. CA-243310]
MTVPLGTGDQVADIRTTWGMDFPPERRWTDGWGVSVELPAVLELIDPARAGVVSLDNVREQMAARPRHEAASWIGEHTGSRGGKRYRTCKLCEPDLTGLTDCT